MEYLVHWHVYDEVEDIWVSEQDIVHAQQILQKYQYVYKLF